MKPKIILEPPGPKARKVLARDASIMSNSLTRAYPLVVERAKGSNLWDVDGNRYLDFNSCIAVMNLGHSNKRILRALREQALKATHAGFLDFYGEPPLSFSEKLVSLMPKGLNRVFLSNSGTESIEAAMKLARWHTGRKYFLAFYDGFHGRSLGALSLTSTKTVHRAGFGPFYPVIHVPYPNPYRNPFGVEGEEVVNEVMGYIEEYVFGKEVDPSEVAALFVEPVQGEGGYVVPPKGFLKELEKLCKTHGLVFVDDEVQSGGMRTGRFLAIEHFGAKPSVVCMAKSIGGGMPLGATVFGEELNKWPPYSHASTFGGNFLACAAGREALEILGQKKLSKKVTRDGEYAIKYLKDLQSEAELIGDVRGIGLMIGIELVKDRASKTPAIEERKKLELSLFKRGVCVLGAGKSVIRIAPPLTIPREDLEAGLEIISEEIKKLSMQKLSMQKGRR